MPNFMIYFPTVETPGYNIKITFGYRVFNLLPSILLGSLKRTKSNMFIPLVGFCTCCVLKQDIFDFKNLYCIGGSLSHVKEVNEILLHIHGTPYKGANVC